MTRKKQRQNKKLVPDPLGGTGHNFVAPRVSIEQLPIAELQFNERNPRHHTPKQIQQIADSIQEFGFLGVVVVDDQARIIAGHARALAAKKLGMTVVPAIRARHLSAAQLRAFSIADNKLALNADWDIRLLGESFRELTTLNLDFSLDITGFEIPEIDLTIQKLDQLAVEPMPMVPTMAGPAVTQSGDLWLLGKHRILCGDATKALEFSQLMNGEKAAMVFSDPPYNVRINGHATGKGRNKHREFAQASGEMTPAQFTSFLKSALGPLAASARDGSIHFICMDWRHSTELLAAGEEVYEELKNICVWVKDNAGMGSLYRSQHEFVFVFKKGRAPHANNVELGKHGRHRTNVWNYPGANSSAHSASNPLEIHPTVKPIALVMDTILDCSRRGDIILDSFLGSGTTLLAAERTGRLCYGLEIDPQYVDTIIRRWQALTALDARRAGDDRTFDDLERQKRSRNERA